MSVELKIRQMLDNGATKGMIKVKLAKEGIEGDEFESLYSEVERQKKTSIRNTGWLLFAGGTFIAVVGICVVFLGEGRGRFPLILILFGIIAGLLGLVSLRTGMSIEE